MSSRLTATDLALGTPDSADTLFYNLKQLLSTAQTSTSPLLEVDQLTGQIYASYRQLHSSNLQNIRKLGDVLKEYSNTLEHCRTDRNQLLQSTSDRHELMQKLNDASEQCLALLTENETLYNTLNKMEEIKEAMTKKIEVLEQSLKREQLIVQERLDSDLEKFKKEQNSQNRLRKDYMQMATDFQELVEANSAIQADLQNMQTTSKDLLNTRVRLSVYGILLYVSAKNLPRVSALVNSDLQNSKFNQVGQAEARKILNDFYPDKSVQVDELLAHEGKELFC